MKNYGLICDVAERWKRGAGRYVERDELRNGAVLLAAHCLRSFDPSRGNFSTYLYKAARNHERYVDSVKHYRGFGFLLSINEFESDDESESSNKYMPVSNSDTYEDAMDQISNKELRQAISKLPKDLREHAHQTLNGTVTWNHVAHTVDLRNRMLKALREELS